MTARRSLLAAGALFVVLTFVLTYPLSVTANRTLPSDDPDGHLFMWTLAWDAHAFLHQPLSIFDANIFYPSRDSLAFSENLIGSAFFAAPVLWITGNPVLAVNVVSLLSCILCGLGAYVLGRRLGLSGAGAALAGIVFAFSPPRFFRFSQIHLTTVQWIPFMLASLHAYLERGHKRDLRLAIGLFTLQAITSGHGGIFAAVAMVLLLAYRLALGEPVRFGQRLRDVGVAGALLLAPVALFAIPYRIAQLDVGLRRELDPSGTPLQNFLASPTHVDAFLQSLLTARPINASATAWLFPGVAPLLLALVAVGWGIGRLRLPRKAAPPGPRLARARFKVPAAICLAALSFWFVLGLASSLVRGGDGLTPQFYGGGRIAWSGYINVAQPGRYTFGVDSPGAAHLTIDSRVIIDRGVAQPDAASDGATTLDAGSHRMLLEVARDDDRPSLNLTWAREGGSGLQAVPSSALSRRPIGGAMAIVLRAFEWARAGSLIAAACTALWMLSGWFRSRERTWTTLATRLRQDPTAFYLLLTVVSTGLAIGGREGLWQFVYWMPGFNFIRGSSRFTVLGVLGLAVLAGVGFEKVTAAATPGRRRAAALIIGAMMVAEFSAIPYRGVPYRLDIPAADQWVARQPKPFSIAEVPVTTSDRYHSNYMLHSMAHWQKTVHGFSGIRPPLHEELYDQLRSFPSDDSVRRLAELGVTYVIVHGSWFPPEERRLVEERLPAFGSWLTLEYTDPDSRVYSIHHPSGKEF